MDVGLFIGDDGIVRPELEAGDLKADEGLETAVLISLFSDQRAEEIEVPNGQTSRRGYWGDMYPPVEGDRHGSKIWTHERSKASLSVLAALETRILEALDWMIKDGAAVSVSAEGEIDDFKQMFFTIEITRPTGENDRFSLIWDKQELSRL
jgi:phage gp46-like protein